MAKIDTAQLDALVLLAQQGNKEAFDLLYEYTYPLLLNFAFRLCSDRQMALDSVQEAWLKSTQSITKMNDPRVFKSWMFRAVKWKVHDMQRSAKSRQSLSESLASQPEAVLAQSATDEYDLKAAISLLPAIEKEVMYLFYLNDFSVNEISIIQKVPIGTIKSRLSRARHRLIQERG